MLKRARDVRLGRCERLADALVDRQVPPWDGQRHFSGSRDRTITYLLVVDTINFSFWGGTLIATLVQTQLPAPRRAGRVIILALTFGSGVLALMALPLPFRLLVALCAAWGLGGGVVMTQARTIVQLGARDSHRARILAVFQLGLIGGAPLGAVLIGYVAGAVGPRHATIYPALAMLVVLLWLATRSGLWRASTFTSAAGGRVG